MVWYELARRRVMANEPERFHQHCERISELIALVPIQSDREELRAAIETLVSNLYGPWFGYRVAWVSDTPDTIEGIEL